MKIKQPAQYIDHLMRQTRAHHVQLSSMADLKANMVLTMASLVVTLTAPHLDEPRLRIAGAVLILFCLGAIMCAAYSVMPKVPWHPSGPRPDIENKQFNILFFGDFTKLTYQEYEEGMESIMNDPDKAYEAQVREVYTLGVFLARKKYRFLRYAYLLFIAGLLCSGLILVADMFS